MGQIEDAFSKEWTAYWIHVISNPKSSAQGALSFIAIIALALAAVLPPGSKLAPACVAIAAAVPKLVVGFGQKDPGSVPATTPDNPTPHSEASTEIPLNPDAKIV
jgi:hypothetical protein